MLTKSGAKLMDFGLAKTTAFAEPIRADNERHYPYLGSGSRKGRT